jgi:hypothetical protein
MCSAHLALNSSQQSKRQALLLLVVVMAMLVMMAMRMRLRLVLQAVQGRRRHPSTCETPCTCRKPAQRMALTARVDQQTPWRLQVGEAVPLAAGPAAARAPAGPHA